MCFAKCRGDGCVHVFVKLSQARDSESHAFAGLAKKLRFTYCANHAALVAALVGKSAPFASTLLQTLDFSPDCSAPVATVAKSALAHSCMASARAQATSLTSALASASARVADKASGPGMQADASSAKAWLRLMLPKRIDSV